MPLNGIDISSWQDDLNLADTWQVDFAIVKLTGGVGYVNPSAQKHMLQGFGAGKMMGCYHFAQESGYHGSARDEALFFVNSFRPYIGKAIPFLDWEADALALDQWWAKEWLDVVRSETGMTPGIYMGKSVCHRDWSAVAPEYPLWVAQYASMDPTSWQDYPWTDDSGYGAWGGPTWFQFTSTGYIEGYGGRLDLNVFYGERPEWERLCGGSYEPPAPVADCAEIAAQIHADMCNDENNGYSWEERWGQEGNPKTLNIYGRDYTYNLGDRDCSSSAIEAWKLAVKYTPWEGSLDGATYTGNMRDVFVNSGLFDVWDTDSTSAERGDLYLNDESHVAMCQYGGQGGTWDSLSEFSWGDVGAYGNTRGDQSGWESHITDFYSYPWWCTLHYNHRADGTQDGGDAPWTPPAPEPAPSGDQPRYRVSTDPSGQSWYGEMVGRYATDGSGDDYGGAMGEIMRYVAIADVGQYRVCTQASGWLPWVDQYNVGDLVNGCAGDGSPIIALEISNGSVRYALHNQYGEWNDPMVGNWDSGGSGDWYAGAMVPADALYVEWA